MALPSAVHAPALADPCPAAHGTATAPVRRCRHEHAGGGAELGAAAAGSPAAERDARAALPVRAHRAPPAHRAEHALARSLVPAAHLLLHRAHLLCSGGGLRRTGTWPAAHAVPTIRARACWGWKPRMRLWMCLCLRAAHALSTACGRGGGLARCPGSRRNRSGSWGRAHGPALPCPALAGGGGAADVQEPTAPRPHHLGPA